MYILLFFFFDAVGYLITVLNGKKMNRVEIVMIKIRVHITHPQDSPQVEALAAWREFQVPSRCPSKSSFVEKHIKQKRVESALIKSKPL